MTKIFDGSDLRCIMGIILPGKYHYVIELKTLQNIDTSFFTDKMINVYKEKDEVKFYLNQLEGGDFLPAIILGIDGKTIISGHEIVAAYILKGTLNFYSLVQHTN